VARHPGEGGVAAAADQQARPVEAGIPELVPLVQVVLQPPPPRPEGGAGGLVVVPSRADADAEREPALRQPLNGCGLAGDQHRWAERRDQHQRSKPDPVGDRSGGIEDPEALEAVPGQPVVDAQGAELGGVGVAGPAEEQVGRRAGDDGREADA